MAEESGTPPRWLPPRAPGGQPPPRFDREPELPAPPPPPRPDPQVAADRPVFVRPRAQQAGNGLAVAALVLGIAGVGVLLISLGLAFIFTLPCSIAAWLCAAQARARIDAGETDAGRGQAQAGYLLGVIGVVLGVAAMVTWIALIASGFSVEELRDDLQRELDRQRNSDSVETRLLELRTVAAALLGR